MSFKYRFNPEKLAKLIEISNLNTPQSWVGIAPSGWVGFINKHAQNLDVNMHRFSKTPLDRQALYAMAAETEVSDLEFALNVLSWGGMRRDHGARLFKTVEQWIHVIGQIRSGRFTREIAYEEFQRLRIEGSLSGMGPAFFTKLIFFGLPAHDGYILDQWTGRSINFLLDKQLVKLQRTKTGHRVSDSNDSLIYSNFCTAIEELTALLPTIDDARYTEELLFSWGGRKKGLWRSYLLELS